MSAQRVDAALDTSAPLQLVRAAAALRWKRPDLTATLAELALDAATDAETWVGAAGWLLHGRSVLGDGRSLACDLLDGLARWGEAGTELMAGPCGRRLRVELAGPARRAGDPVAARALLAADERVDSGDAQLHADALTELARSAVDGAPGAADDALDAAEQAWAVAGSDPGIASVLLLRAAHARRAGRAEAAVVGAVTGLARVNAGGRRAGVARSDHLAAALTAEWIAALVDAGRPDEARGEALAAAQRLLATARIGRQRAGLRLAVARVAAVAGTVDDVQQALEPAARDAADGDVPDLESACRSMLGELHETTGRLDEALAAVRAAMAAERRDHERGARLRGRLAAVTSTWAAGPSACGTVRRSSRGAPAESVDDGSALDAARTGGAGLAGRGDAWLGRGAGPAGDDDPWLGGRGTSLGRGARDGGDGRVVRAADPTARVNLAHDTTAPDGDDGAGRAAGVRVGRRADGSGADDRGGTRGPDGDLAPETTVAASDRIERARERARNWSGTTGAGRRARRLAAENAAARAAGETEDAGWADAEPPELDTALSGWSAPSTTGTAGRGRGEQVDRHRADGHRADGHRADGHRADGHRPGALRVDGSPVDGPRTDEQRVDGHRADEARADRDLVDRPRADGSHPDGSRADRHWSVAHRADENRVDGHRADGHRADGLGSTGADGGPALGGGSPSRADDDGRATDVLSSTARSTSREWRAAGRTTPRSDPATDDSWFDGTGRPRTRAGHDPVPQGTRPPVADRDVAPATADTGRSAALTGSGSLIGDALLRELIENAATVPRDADPGDTVIFEVDPQDDGTPAGAGRARVGGPIPDAPDDLGSSPIASGRLGGPDAHRALAVDGPADPARRAPRNTTDEYPAVQPAAPGSGGGLGGYPTADRAALGSGRGPGRHPATDRYGTGPDSGTDHDPAAHRHGTRPDSGTDHDPAAHRHGTRPDSSTDHDPAAQRHGTRPDSSTGVHPTAHRTAIGSGGGTGEYPAVHPEGLGSDSGTGGYPAADRAGPGSGRGTGGYPAFGRGDAGPGIDPAGIGPAGTGPADTCPADTGPAGIDPADTGPRAGTLPVRKPRGRRPEARSENPGAPRPPDQPGGNPDDGAAHPGDPSGTGPAAPARQRGSATAETDGMGLGDLLAGALAAYRSI